MNVSSFLRVHFTELHKTVYNKPSKGEQTIAMYCLLLALTIPPTHFFIVLGKSENRFISLGRPHIPTGRLQTPWWMTRCANGVMHLSTWELKNINTPCYPGSKHLFVFRSSIFFPFGFRYYSALLFSMENLS